MSQEGRTGQSPPCWPAVASRGLGDPLEPCEACLGATTAWVPVTESSERPFQATVQARGVAEGWVREAMFQ